MPSRTVYRGTHRQLVIAFDVGTTFSGTSYSVLEPGQVPVIRAVTRYPAQDGTNGASKIPTILYYDKAGKIRAAGAEATRDGFDIMARENGWMKAEWFKLHLRNKDTTFANGTSTGNKTAIRALPPGKSAVDVFSDFLGYLHACTAQYIKDTHLNGEMLWAGLKDNINYVLAHPNGWEGSEQTKMREAAFMAGLIPERNTARLSFVTEGEASLHFCVRAGVLSQTNTKSGGGFIIVDAGGGTIDISAYKQEPGSNMKAFEEIAPAQCILQGSVYVNEYAKVFLTGLLEDSDFADDIDHIVDIFQKSTKLRFKTDDEPQFIKFGGTRDNDISCNIKFGQLKLDGRDVAAFFQPSIDNIVHAILHQRQVAIGNISHVLFVGGFSANDWVFNNVSTILKKKWGTVHVSRPEDHSNKAVAEGAASSFVDHIVSMRVSKIFFGVGSSIVYNPHDMEHKRRVDCVFQCASGEMRVPKRFSVILPKDTQLSGAKVFRESYSRAAFMRSELKKVKCTILSYNGRNASPRWVDVDAGNYVSICRVEAVLPTSAITTEQRADGRCYYQVTYEVLLRLGLTEIKAQIAWTDSTGKEMRGPAKVVYDLESED